MDDTIGCLLETQEGFPKKKAELLWKCLRTTGDPGACALTVTTGQTEPVTVRFTVV